MKIVDQWRSVIPNKGFDYMFSPSGHAVAFQSMLHEPFLQVIEVCFADGREPLVVAYDEPIIIPYVWASDSELVYRVSGQPLGTAPEAWLWVLSIEGGDSRPLVKADNIRSVQWSGRSGHLSVLAEPGGQMGLFDLDTETGTMQRLSAFDAALERLEVYPLFRHSFCHARQEVVLVAWERGDYVPEGAEPDRKNGAWLDAFLNIPSVQNIVQVQADGTSITQREMMAQDRRKTHARLYLLDASGECREIPGTHKAHHPIWSPDGTMLSFQRHDHFDPQHNTGSCGSVWVAQREDLSLMRLGGCGVAAKTIMHPSGVLLCELENETIIQDIEFGALRLLSKEWAGFVLQGGDVKPE